MRHYVLFRTAAVVLLLLNLTLLAVVFLGRPPAPGPGPGPGGFREEAADLLRLDADQRTAFAGLARAHRAAVDSLGRRQRGLLEPYFLTAGGAAGDADRLQAEILRIEAEKLAQTHAHFRDVKALLRADQRKQFTPFVRRALGVILTDGGKNPPPPQDF